MQTRTGCLLPLRATALAVVTAAVAAASCGKVVRDDAGEDGLAEVVLALTAAPADVRCIVITATTDRADVRRFDVGAGASTSFVLKRLPVGVVVFTVDAYAAACSAAAGTVPTWVGGPQTAGLTPGSNGTINIEMRRNGQLSVNVGFAPVPPLTCAPVGSACLIDSDCCAGGGCAIAPDPGSIGVCKPVVKAPSVALALKGEHHYILYSDAGGAGCGDPSATTSWLHVNEF